MDNKCRNIIDKSSPIPAYHQIASDLIARITAGEWKIGDKLPPETELVKEYSVSRVTMRQALSELEGRGLINRIQGKGSFLTTHPTPFIEDLGFPSPRAKEKKLKPDEIRILEWKFIKSAPLNVQQMFGLGQDQSLVFLSRVFLCKGKPIGLNCIWFPAEMVPDIIAKGLQNKSVSGTLSKLYVCSQQKKGRFLKAHCKMNLQ